MCTMTQSYSPRSLSILLPGSQAPQKRASRHPCLKSQPRNSTYVNGGVVGQVGEVGHPNRELPLSAHHNHHNGCPNKLKNRCTVKLISRRPYLPSKITSTARYAKLLSRSTFLTLLYKVACPDVNRVLQLMKHSKSALRRC
jgi:hypothetical protein